MLHTNKSKQTIFSSSLGLVTMLSMVAKQDSCAMIEVYKDWDRVMQSSLQSNMDINLCKLETHKRMQHLPLDRLKKILHKSQIQTSQL